MAHISSLTRKLGVFLFSHTAQYIIMNLGHYTSSYFEGFCYSRCILLSSSAAAAIHSLSLLPFSATGPLFCGRNEKQVRRKWQLNKLSIIQSEGGKKTQSGWWLCRWHATQHHREGKKNANRPRNMISGASHCSPCERQSQGAVWKEFVWPFPPEQHQLNLCSFVILLYR